MGKWPIPCHTGIQYERFYKHGAGYRTSINTHLPRKVDLGPDLQPGCSRPGIILAGNDVDVQCIIRGRDAFRFVKCCGNAMAGVKASLVFDIITDAL